MRVLTVVGARPQFVKAAPVSRALRIDHEEILVHTGQHYDEAMSGSFFRDLEIPAPVNLEVGSGTHGTMRTWTTGPASAPILTGMVIDLPVIFPVHPSTRAMLAGGGATLPSNVIPIDPVGYLAMVALEARADLIATDSGGVQKEAYLSGVPCVTLRSETEWVETVKAGWNRMANDDPGAVRAALADEAFMDRDRERPVLYGDGAKAAQIVVALEQHHAGTRETRTPQEGTVW
ncbi:hypothetical protein BH24CHL10_BH24CHL10_00070 [soil metagenome]